MNNKYRVSYITILIASPDNLHRELVLRLFDFGGLFSSFSDSASSIEVARDSGPVFLRRLRHSQRLSLFAASFCAKGLGDNGDLAAKLIPTWIGFRNTNNTPFPSCCLSALKKKGKEKKYVFSV